MFRVRHVERNQQHGVVFNAASAEELRKALGLIRSTLGGWDKYDCLEMAVPPNWKHVGSLRNPAPVLWLWSLIKHPDTPDLVRDAAHVELAALRKNSCWRFTTKKER